MALKPASLAIVCAFTLSCLANAQTPNWLEIALKSRLAEFSSTAFNPQKPATTRDLTNAALLNRLTGGEAALSENWIERAYATQVMDTASPNYGELKWKTSDDAMTDLNAVEFATQAIGPFYLSYGKELSAGFKARMAPHLAAALQGLDRHNVPVTYTNIFLMNLVSRMLIGQATGDNSSVTQAGRQLVAWLDYTHQNGIHEFDSPTYYSADLDSLVEGYRYAASAEDRRNFERALNYFWTDIAASYLPGAQRMAGAYSRDYDFLRGHGGMNIWLTDAGWATYAESTLDLEKVFVLDNRRAGGYRTRPELAALSAQFPREVVSSWDGDPHHLRFLWMNGSVALGCTSGDYGPQDKLFNATFAGSADLAQISIVPDTFDAPYGMVKNLDKSGHNKPTHQPLHAACVEQGGAALVTLDLNPAAIPGDATGFATNILLPSEAAIAVNAKPRSLTAPAAFSLQADDVVTATLGNATVAIRLAHLDDLPEQKAALTLVADSEGLSHHTVRIRIAHLSAGLQSRSKHLRVAFLIVARQDVSAEAVTREVQSARITGQQTVSLWSVQTALKDTTLEVARSSEDRKQILRQLVNGAAIAPTVLSVNGKDLAGAILQGVP